jgi:hypothetical protein
LGIVGIYPSLISPKQFEAIRSVPAFTEQRTQCPTANLSCAVAFDGHNINMAPIIKMIFTTEGPPTGRYISVREELIGFATV